MVKSITIKVTAEMVGLSQVNLSQFSGYEIEVQRSGLPLIEGEEFQNRPEGGFNLLGAAMVLNERYTVTPLPKPIAQDVAPSYRLAQYPHTVTLYSVASSVQDAEGNWMQGALNVNERACRAEPNSGGRYLVGVTEDKVYYDFVLYMPLPAETIAAGTKADVYNQEGELLTSGTMKRFNRGQLNARAWL